MKKKRKMEKNHQSEPIYIKTCCNQLILINIKMSFDKVMKVFAPNGRIY